MNYSPRDNLRLLRRLILIEFAGFGSVVALIWLDELLDIPYRVFGALPSPARFLEAELESGAVLVVAAFVIWVTVQMVRRLAYLESFVVMCAWCRRVRLDDEWMTFETYLAAQRAETTHGICPGCAAELKT